jgi:TolB-like protein
MVNRAEATTEGKHETTDIVPIDEARRELSKILADPGFEASPRRRDMLRYIVEETLSGRAAYLKGVSIAQSVFGRDETFDQSVDPVVRIEARRLRLDLASYYAGPGRGNRLRIAIPKGHYVAKFVRVDGADGPDFPLPLMGEVLANKMWLNLAVAGLLIALVVILVIWRFHGDIFGDDVSSAASSASSLAAVPPHGPSILVRRFAANGGTREIALADGIAQQLVANLLRFPDIRIYQPTDETLDDEALVRKYDITYLVDGNLTIEAAQFRFIGKLIGTQDNNVIWSKTYKRELKAGNILDVEEEVAGDIASALGQPYGVIKSDPSRKNDPQLGSYECVLSAYDYRLHPPGNDTFRPVLECLEEAVLKDPEYAEAWAMLAYQYLDQVRFGRVDKTEHETMLAKASASASRGMAIDPGNAMAIKALSAINHYLGNYDEGNRLARQAVEVNPYDPDTLYQLGWRLAVRGNFDEGVPLLERSISQTVNPKGSYFHLLTLDRLMNGDGEGMLQLAERGAIEESAISQMLVAIAHGQLGNTDAARQALLRMQKISPQAAEDPLAPFRRARATSEIIEAVRAGLDRAGWPDAVSTPVQ